MLCGIRKHHKIQEVPCKIIKLGAKLENGGQIQKSQLHTLNGEQKVSEVPHLKFAVTFVVSEITIVSR